MAIQSEHQDILVMLERPFCLANVAAPQDGKQIMTSKSSYCK